MELKRGIQMNKRKNNRINKKNKELIITLISFVIILVTSLLGGKLYLNSNNNLREHKAFGDISTDKLQVNFIDVGQADSILVSNKNETMLIDAGNNENGKDIVDFIKEKGITKINYLIGTHPHADHIGGLDDVIKSDLEIDNVYMPKIQTNTKTFEDVLDAIQSKGLKVIAPQKGDAFKIGDANCEVMTDSILDKENLNLSSIVIRLAFGENSFLFMGDSELENEKAISWPKTDVLKVGHHGSNTSSSENFLSQVNPQYAVIMAGKDNTYGLPKQKILDRLNKIGAKIYRTDENGTITMVSDGKTIEIQIN